MRQISIIILSVTILLPGMAKTGLYIWFKTNQVYIAKNLCVKRNTNEAESCNGCCQLNKKIKVINKASDNDSNTLPALKLKDNILLFDKLGNEYLINLLVNTFPFRAMLVEPILKFTFKIFHPPKFL